MIHNEPSYLALLYLRSNLLNPNVKQFESKGSSFFFFKFADIFFICFFGAYRAKDNRMSEIFSKVQA